MSNYRCRDRIKAGPIHGDPLEGLCHRVTISVKRVLDSCTKKEQLDNANLVLRNISTRAIPPFTFTSAANTQVDAGVTNLVVTRLQERPCFARIQCNVNVPLQVGFLSSSGEQFYADSDITVSEDIVMFVPEASMFPFEITAVASCNFTSGTVEGSNMSGTACLAVITKVIAETDLLMPTYGYCAPPDAVDFEEEVCNKFFELPLYPSGR